MRGIKAGQGGKAAFAGAASGKAMRRRASSKMGSVTLEAALALPFLLCAFFSVVFIIKAVYTYEMVQHALDETASGIASSGYIYHISGVRDLHDTARDGVNDRAELFKGQIDSVFAAYSSIKNMGNGPGSGLPDISNGADMLSQAGEAFDNMVREAEKAASDPLEELKSIACYIASGAFDDAKTELFTPVVKLYMKKHLVSGSASDIDERLEALNIAGGFGGMDFSESSFLADSGENIDIVVRYRIKLPLPIRFVSDFVLVQRARVKAWMGGDESTGVLEDAADDLWSLSNFQRGRKIQRIFGANLPFNFPVIAGFENGKAVMIKSMDLTAESYQKGDHALDALMGYVEELAGYGGQEKPWGGSGTVIRKKDIREKELLLVIPENKLSDANEKLLSDMSGIARSRGISLVVKRYGTKANDEDSSPYTE